jgi:hypothetical protein
MKVKLVFNLDKVGMSEQEDRKGKKVIVAMTTAGQTIDCDMSRSMKHISVVACVTARRESRTPFIMTSQISDGIRKRLLSRGVRLGVDFVLRQRPKPYVSSKLLFEYVKTIFVPYLNEQQDLEEFNASEAVILIDHYSLHISDDVVAVLTHA